VSAMHALGLTPDALYTANRRADKYTGLIAIGVVNFYAAVGDSLFPGGNPELFISVSPPHFFCQHVLSRIPVFDLGSNLDLCKRFIEAGQFPDAAFPSFEIRPRFFGAVTQRGNYPISSHDYSSRHSCSFQKMCNWLRHIPV